MPLSHSCFFTSLFILSVFLYSPFSFLFLYSLFSSLFSVVFFLAIFLTYFSLLSACLSLFFLLLLLSFTMHSEGLFILPSVMSFTVLPLNYFWPDVGVHPRPPIGLSAAQPSSLLCASRATFHSQTKEFCFVFLLSVAFPFE